MPPASQAPADPCALAHNLITRPCGLWRRACPANPSRAGYILLRGVHAGDRDGRARQA